MEQGNRREFLRARVSFPARCKILQGQELDLVKQGLGVTLFRAGDQPDPIEEFASTMPSGTQTDIFYHCFQNLNNKLDFIIEQLAFPEQKAHLSFKEVIEISGSGFKLLSKEAIPDGTYMKVDLIMPSTIQFRIELIAEVIRTEMDAETGKYEVAAKIIDIDETARDAIIEAVFRKQRKVIRKEKALKEGLCEQD